MKCYIEECAYENWFRGMEVGMVLRNGVRTDQEEWFGGRVCKNGWRNGVRTDWEECLEEGFVRMAGGMV